MMGGPEIVSTDTFGAAGTQLGMRRAPANPSETMIQIQPVPPDRLPLNTAYYIKWGVAVMLSFWVDMPVAVQVLFVLMAFEFASAFMLAIKERRWDKQEECWEIVGKTFTLLLLLGCKHLAEIAHVKFDVASGLAVVFAVNEFSSAVKNCRGLGVKIPIQVVDFLSNVKTLTNNTPKRPVRRTRGKR